MGTWKFAFKSILTFTNLPPPRLYVETTVVHKEWKTFFLFVESKEFFSIKSFILFFESIKNGLYRQLWILRNQIQLNTSNKTLWRYYQMVVGGKKNKDVQSNNSTWGTIVVKSNFFVRFLGELKIPKRHFEINRPLAW